MKASRDDLRLKKIYRRLSRCRQLGGLVPVLRLGVPLRYKASKLEYTLKIFFTFCQNGKDCYCNGDRLSVNDKNVPISYFGADLIILGRFNTLYLTELKHKCHGFPYEAVEHRS